MADADRSPEAESTALPAALQTCLFCGAPVEPAQRGGTRLFCNDRHRSAYRVAQVRAAIQEVKAALTDTKNELARLQARLEGAEMLLERYAKPPVRRTAQKKVETT